MIKKDNSDNQILLGNKTEDEYYVLCELGCGVGNTLFPLKNEYPNLRLV